MNRLITVTKEDSGSEGQRSPISAKEKKTKISVRLNQDSALLTHGDF